MAKAKKKDAAPSAAARVPSSFAQPTPVVMLSDPYGPAAEAMRVLRTRVQSQHLQAGRRGLAICGPTPEVGATFVAVNLAVALSQIGVKTLLVDGNLREPSIDKYFSLSNGEGLTGVLVSSFPATDFIDEDVLPNLDILAAGRTDATSHELLASARFAEVANAWMRDYDMTIIDTAPANSCSDGLRISTMVGYSLIVARKNRTLVSDISVLADQLKKERARVLGTVLNHY